MSSVSFIFSPAPGAEYPRSRPGAGIRASARAGFARPAAAPGPSGDWSEDWGGDWPRECVLSLRPIQYSSFMSRPGLRWRVRWGKDSDSEPEWGKGPVGGREAGVLCPSWPAGPPREDSPKASAPSSPEEKDAWEVERRGQRGRLPLGLCAASCLGPLGGGLAAQHSTFLERGRGAHRREGQDFCTQYYSLASPWVCSSPGRVRPP